MDYKEIHQQCYDRLEEDLGREPEWFEIDSAFRDEISLMVDAIRDQYKYEAL
jgi:hypothetical protein